MAASEAVCSPVEGSAGGESPAGEGCCAPRSCSESRSPVLVRLTSLRVGQVATVCDCALEPREAAVLRAMGLRESARVRVCKAGEPIVLEVLYEGSGCSCRIGLARPLAGRVTVADPTPA